MKLKKKTYQKYKGKVFDLGVETEDHSYTINNLVVHNSAAGSLISYLMNITGVNPIDYKLMFQRFLTKGRVAKTLPD